MPEPKKEVKRIVRFMATDIDGSTPTGKALRRIKGISFMLSNAICIMTNTDSKKVIGLLGETELRGLENAVNILNTTMPKWMLNRRKDMETGSDLHLTGTKLDLQKREDINLLRRIKAYRGVRHELGQPSRGQRTRSSFRTQKSVGVSKKAARAQAKPKKEETPAKK